MADLGTFTSKIKSGVQQNRFKIQFVFPAGVDGALDASVLAKGAPLPSKTVGSIDLNYQGRQIHIPGDLKFGADWSVTLFSDPSMNLRKYLNDWMDLIVNPTDNVKGSVDDIKTDGTNVVVLDSQNNEIYTVTLNGLWIKEIGEIEFNHDNEDALVEIPVTFSLDSWDDEGGTAGLTAGSGFGGLF